MDGKKFASCTSSFGRGRMQPSPCIGQDRKRVSGRMPAGCVGRGGKHGGSASTPVYRRSPQNSRSTHDLKSQPIEAGGGVWVWRLLDNTGSFLGVERCDLVWLDPPIGVPVALGIPPDISLEKVSHCDPWLATCTKH